MNVRTLRNSDKASIRRWLKSEQPINMPYNAFGVPGVAFAGIRAVDGGFWLFDSMVTNSLCSSETRHRALEAIYKYMFALTKDSNGIIGLTMDDGALERARRNGFRQLPYTVLAYTPPRE